MSRTPTTVLLLYDDVSSLCVYYSYVFPLCRLIGVCTAHDNAVHKKRIHNQKIIHTETYVRIRFSSRSLSFSLLAFSLAFRLYIYSC